MTGKYLWLELFTQTTDNALCANWLIWASGVIGPHSLGSLDRGTSTSDAVEEYGFWNFAVLGSHPSFAMYYMCNLR